MTNPLTRLRNACAEIGQIARWVQIDPVQAMKYPEYLTLSNTPMCHSKADHFLGHGEDTLIYFLVLDAINFGSGYFPFLDQISSSGSGYLYAARRLKAFFESKGAPKPKELAQITNQQCHDIFGLATDNPHAAELMYLYSAALNQLGHWVLSNYNGEFLGFLRQSRSVASSITKLTEMPFFRDVATYGTITVSFLKRAQILLHDMKIAEPKNKLLDFDDFDELTIFADNLIPFVLREDGALTYHPWLGNRIDSGEVIGSNSLEEIEIRACAITACELIKDVITEEWKHVSAREIDYLLWHRAQELKSVSRHRRHITRCVYY
jgi:hypothetical protein